MPASHRHQSRRPQPPRQAPVLPLAAIVAEYEKWRQAQNGRPGRGALRDYWRAQDAKHAARADYQLWRHTQCLESLPEKRQDVTHLITQALRHSDADVRFEMLALAVGWLLNGQSAEVVQRLRPSLQGEMKRQVPKLAWQDLTLWLLGVVLGDDPARQLSVLRNFWLKLDPAWKPGRGVPIRGVFENGGLMPAQCFQQWLVMGLRQVLSQLLVVVSDASQNHEISAWQVTLWMLLRDARPAQSPVRYAEIEVLLEAAASARLAGQGIEAARCLSLALHLLPERLPPALKQRCQVAVWTLAELGLAIPPTLAVSLDELPFPGEPVASEKGQEAAQLFRDEADRFQNQLITDLDTDEDWQKLRAAGVVLIHPLAALAWVGKKAQAYGLKKQHDLLRASARLATRHGALGTLARLRAEFPESPEAVSDLAQQLREGQRRLPFCRDDQEWQRQVLCLRQAWGRLEGDLKHESEELFFLHETLLDREATLMRCLPEDVRVLALKHLHGRRAPTQLVQHLEQQPKAFQCLEHQRAVELWSIASETRERPELNGIVWVSAVLRGDAASGKYSWIMQSASGRETVQGRVKSLPGAGPDYASLLAEMGVAARALCADARTVILASSPELRELDWQQAFAGAPVMQVPSWEWAFRTLREPAKVDVPCLQAFVLTAADTSVVKDLMPSALGAPSDLCLLVPGQSVADAASRWLAAEAPESPPKRSLAVGTHRVVMCLGRVSEGRFRDDLQRLSLAQRGRCFISARRTLSLDESSVALEMILKAGNDVLLLERVRLLMMSQPGLWSVSGVLW